MNRLRNPWIPLLVTGLGIAALVTLLRSSAASSLLGTNNSLGLGLGLVFLSFLPHFFLYALGWWVLHKPIADANGGLGGFLRLFAMNQIAFAWNSVGPISRSMGEVGRVYLLARQERTDRALESVLGLNVTQTLGTLGTFALGALAALLCVRLAPLALLLAGACFVVALGLKWLAWRWVRQPGRRDKRARSSRFRKARHWISRSVHLVRKQYRRSPATFGLALALAVASRAAESLVLYATLWLLGHPVSLVQALVIETGRGVADNLFFFMPYQVGTREASIVLVAGAVAGVSSSTAISASLAFRAGELLWVMLGLLLAPALTLARGELRARQDKPAG